MAGQTRVSSGPRRNERARFGNSAALNAVGRRQDNLEPTRGNVIGDVLRQNYDSRFAKNLISDLKL